MKTESLEIRLTKDQIAGLDSVAAMAGVKKETVIKVLLALYVLKNPMPEVDDGRG